MLNICLWTARRSHTPQKQQQNKIKRRRRSGRVVFVVVVKTYECVCVQTANWILASPVAIISKSHTHTRTRTWKLFHFLSTESTYSNLKAKWNGSSCESLIMIWKVTSVFFFAYVSRSTGWGGGVYQVSGKAVSIATAERQVRMRKYQLIIWYMIVLLATYAVEGESYKYIYEIL